MVASSRSSTDEFIKGLWKENPVFVQVLGMCPALAVSNTAMNALAMGLATAFVLVMSLVLVLFPLVFVVLLIVYVGIMAARLGNLSREIESLAELAERRERERNQGLDSARLAIADIDELRRAQLERRHGVLGRRRSVLHAGVGQCLI